MKQIMDFLLREKHIPSSSLAYVNFEIDYLKYNSASDLDRFVQSKRAEAGGSRLYLFLDEIQELSGWEKLLNSYRADDAFDVDIFITGSNANVLSSELSTYLAGRYVDFEIFPFDYREYLGYWKMENTTGNFLSYLESSGISELYKMPDDEGRLNFLKSLKDTIILKDIVKRYRIKDVDFLEKLFSYLSGNIGNLFSFNSIVKKLKGIHVDSNAVTIGNYLQYLEKTYVIHSCQRYDLKGKKILE
jgi:predicted AAA+ superfamily ATPase